jgi:hypothetical protein
VTFLVWRYGAGQYPCDASHVHGAVDYESAAAYVHEHMDEPSTNEVFFVQAAEGDRKVRVVCSELEYSPSAYGRVQELAALKARCTGCRRRQLDEDTVLVGGLCRRCGYKQYQRATA